MILNQTVNEILDDNDYDDELPTNEEIDKVVEYFKMRDSENAYETYNYKLLQDYVIQIYDKIGDKIVKTQGSNILENYKKSKNKKNRDRCCLDTF